MNEADRQTDSPELRTTILRRCFAFLEREYQYRCTRQEHNLLRWDGGHSFFAVGHGPLGACFGLRFGPLRAPGQPANVFEPADLACLLPEGQPLPWSQQPYSSVQELAEIAFTCSRFFYHAAPGLLRGEQGLFDRLAEARRQRESRHALQRAQQCAPESEQPCISASVQPGVQLGSESWAPDDPEAERILSEAEQNLRRRLGVFVRSTKRELWQRHARSFRPRQGDFYKIFTGPAAARAEGLYLSLWQGELPLPAPWPGQTELSLTACFAEWFGCDHPRCRAFPAGYRHIAPLLAPGAIWVAWRYTRPGRDRGAHYEGLVQAGDRWIWLMRPHRLLARMVEPRAAAASRDD